MKNNFVISVLFILGLTGLITGQTASSKVIFSESINPDGSRTAVIRYPGAENPNAKVFETVIPVATVEQCMASTDFSGARPADPNQVRLEFDNSSGDFVMTWTVTRETQNSCRVLTVGESPTASDFNVWRARFGNAGLAEDGKGGSQSDPFTSQSNPPKWGLDRVDQRFHSGN